MKYLIIKDNKGYYRKGEIETEIDKIDKNDLLDLLNAAETKDFKMDEFNSDKFSDNKAHSIIYENIYRKFNDFLNDKQKFRREAESVFKKELEKYSHG